MPVDVEINVILISNFLHISSICDNYSNAGSDSRFRMEWPTGTVTIHILLNKISENLKQRNLLPTNLCSERIPPDLSYFRSSTMTFGTCTRKLLHHSGLLRKLTCQRSVTSYSVY